MGLKNGSSGGVGLTDLETAWEAFQSINSVRVTVRLDFGKAGQYRCIRAFGEAWPAGDGSGEVQPLVSESVICSATDWSSLDTVLFRLLYALDGLLAAHELKENHKAG